MTPEQQLTLDSDWTYNWTGETMRVLYWERGEVFFRKVRDGYGLVGQTKRMPIKTFLECHKKQ